MIVALRLLTRWSWRLCLPLYVAGLVAGRHAAQLPDPAQLDPVLQKEPEQHAMTSRAFEHQWRGKSYVVTPKAAYSLRGLIVSHNEISAIEDIYHDSSSVDVRDICVVWGDTAVNGAYRTVTFWSEPWRCLYQFQGDLEGFSEDELSNNHLLPADELVAREVSRTHIGDQVEMDGMLVDYYPAGASEATRSTSLVRTDRGNGACEVVFVKRFRVIKAGNPGWWQLRHAARFGGLLALGWALCLSPILPYLEFRSRR